MPVPVQVECTVPPSLPTASPPPPTADPCATPLPLRYSDEGLFPGYPWETNSCWLDTALQALFVTLLWDPQSFDVRFQSQVSSQTRLYALYRTLDSRRTLHRSQGPNNTPATLRELRNTFRNMLAAVPLRPVGQKSLPAIIQSTTGNDNIFVC